MKHLKVPVERNRKLLTALHTLTFPSDTVPAWKQVGMAWITKDDANEPVGFLYAEPMADGSLYFSRVGVMPAARGHGIQRALMSRMYARAKREGYKTLISTTYQNPPSANNFVREQWMTYLPAAPWGAADTIYWFKELI